MKLITKLAREYAEDPKHFIPGFKPMGRVDDAFEAGFETARRLAVGACYDSDTDPTGAVAHAVSEIGEEEV
jgi:hypothetical protein